MELSELLEPEDARGVAALGSISFLIFGPIMMLVGFGSATAMFRSDPTGWIFALAGLAITVIGIQFVNVANGKCSECGGKLDFP